MSDPEAHHYRTLQALYKSRAHSAVKRAKEEFERGGPERLRYAALELRLAMEALTFHRALMYREEIPPREYATWQPRKLMKMLKAIQADIDQPYSIAIGEEGQQMTNLGSDSPLSLSTLEEHYYALSSFLHVPTINQSEKQKTDDLDRLKDHCLEVIIDLERSISSPISSNFGTFSTLRQCMEPTCGKPVRRRIPLGATELKAQCFHCQKAHYSLTRTGDGPYEWNAILHHVPCPHCSEPQGLWPPEIKQGTSWRCSTCQKFFELRLAVFNYEPDESDQLPD